MGAFVKQKIVQAYKELLRHDLYLLQVGANERSITHKFAQYLQEEFPDYDVDCEYNRDGVNSKKMVFLESELERLGEKASLNDEDATTVFPDIIVHHRGTQNNLLVIEAKKNLKTNPKDEKKLSAYKDQLGYQHAYFVSFPTKQDVENFTEAQIDDFIIEHPVTM